MFRHETYQQLIASTQDWFETQNPDLVPYTPRPMMWDLLPSLLFFLLGQIVEEEVKQYGVDLRIRFELEDFLAEELDGPDAAAYVDVSICYDQIDNGTGNREWYSKGED